MSKVLAGQYRYELSEARKKELEHFEEQPVKVSCAFCKWSFSGTVKKGREASLRHREKKHPETLLLPPRRRRSGRALSTFRYTTMDDHSIREVEAERQKRAFLNGVDIDSQA